jgi:tRNA A37 threonylcarbamoyladenosine dehydratase
MSDNTSNSARRFGGIERLHGAGSLERLAAAHVCVIGIGGVGSWAAEALARSGVGRLTLIDLDHVAESNVNRQVHALEDTLGQAKVLAMRERIGRINADCTVACIEEFITPENVAEQLPDSANFDCVLDCIDQVRAKAALLAHCRHRKIPVVTTGGAGGRVNPTRIRIDDLSRTTQDALASKLRARLRKDYGFPREAKKKFGVPCVFSDEQIRRPQALACDVDEAGLRGLNCAGYGSSVAVTAGFGFAAAAHCLGILLG